MGNEKQETIGEGKEPAKEMAKEPKGREDFQAWEARRKRQEAEKQKAQNQRPETPQAPEEIVERRLSEGTEGRQLAVPNWRLPADDDEFRMMSLQDEIQIVLETLGQAPEDYVYCYKKGGELIAGVSVTGAKDLAKQKGFIELLIPVSCVLEQGPDGEMYWHAGVRVRDMRKNTILAGFGRQWTKMRLKSGEIIPDEMSWNKSIGKAIRNALLSALPSSEINAYIKEHLPEIARRKGLWT